MCYRYRGQKILTVNRWVQLFCRIKAYSVMQSDGNSFGGDVVLDSFNKTFRDEDNILDQIYKSEYVRIIIMMILILYKMIRKCIITLQYHKKKLNLKIPKILFFIILVLYAVIITVFHVQDDFSAKTVPMYDFITLYFNNM